MAAIDSDENKQSIPITAQEEKEIHRVFELLCGYQQKVRIKEEVKDLTAWLSVNKSRVLSQINSGLVIDEQKVIASNLAASNRLDELNKELQDLESKPDKKITAVDVIEMFKFLKEKVSRKEVEDMIWEVDENLDECVDWQEFRLMFNRNIMDRSGLEPSRLFNLTQFLIYDTNNNGLVSVDETMNLLYARYGRSKMEVKLKELFGEDMHETGRQGGEITFSKFLKAVEKVQMHTFLNTTKGRL
eukprot:gene35294-47425_t